MKFRDPQLITRAASVNVVNGQMPLSQATAQAGKPRAAKCAAQAHSKRGRRKLGDLRPGFASPCEGAAIGTSDAVHPFIR